MNKEIINCMADVVRTMADDDIIDFISEYGDELNIGLISSLITSVNDNEVLSNYVKNVSDNIGTVLCRWYDRNYIDDNGYYYFNSYDIISDKDDFLAEEEKIAKIRVVNELVSDLMNAIGKISTDYEKVKLLNLLFKKIKPAMVSYVSQEFFDNGCRKSFEVGLLGVLRGLHDLDILELLKENDKLLNDREVSLLFNAIESGVLKCSLVDNYEFINDSVTDDYVNEQDDLKDIILNDIKQINNIYSSYGGISHSEELISYVSVLLTDIVEVCYNIEDDDFLEKIFVEIFEVCGALFLSIVVAISDDDIKLRLFDEYDIAGVEGYVEVLSSIRDNNKFRELYDNLDDGFVYGFEGFNDVDRLKLICSRGDKGLAYKMLRDKYNRFRMDSLEENKVIDIELINQVCNLISIFDDKEQVEIYDWFSEIALPEERTMLILPLKNNGIKREFLNDMKRLEIEETSKYVMSKKLYN